MINKYCGIIQIRGSRFSQILDFCGLVQMYFLCIRLFQSHQLLFFVFFEDVWGRGWGCYLRIPHKIESQWILMIIKLLLPLLRIVFVTVFFKFIFCKSRQHMGNNLVLFYLIGKTDVVLDILGTKHSKLAKVIACVYIILLYCIDSSL